MCVSIFPRSSRKLNFNSRSLARNIEYHVKEKKMIKMYIRHNIYTRFLIFNLLLQHKYNSSKYEF